MPDSTSAARATTAAPPSTSLARTIAHHLLARRRQLGRPIFAGLCGPQGSGKSTLAGQLGSVLAEEAVRLVALSIDDLYLTRAERVRNAQLIHPLLGTRGPPGTHDLAMGERLVDALLAGACPPLPSFDKGLDDREPSDRWRVPAGPADIVLLEGWCVGARPQPPDALAEPVNRLEREEDARGLWRRHVNDALSGYQRLFDRLDLLVQLRAPDFTVVRRWRAEQEAALRARRPLRAMNDAELARFMEHYERLTGHIQTKPNDRADLLIELDARRGVRNIAVGGRLEAGAAIR